MTIVNDETILNDTNGGCTSDWTVNGFDTPQDNNNSSATEIYREGTGCCEWVLKENITDGYAYDGISSTDFTDKVFVHWFFITSDADLDKVTELWTQVSSSSGFTTNYARWDAKAQISGLDYYGWFPVVAYMSNPDESAGTPVYTAILSFGWTATTGAAGTKLSGFDQSLLISYIGGHSQTVTLQNLFDHNETNDHGVMVIFGDFLKSHVNIRLGGGTTSNTVFNETNKTLFFDNVQPEHNLGFIFVDNTTGTTTFDLDGWAISWNEQTGTSPEVFTDAQHVDIFRLNACTFQRGGAVTLRDWISDANTFVTNCTFDNCDRIDPKDILFEDNTINNSRETGATGAILLDATGTSRWARLTFNRGSSGHAVEITATGTYTFDGHKFNNYGAAETTTAAVYNNSGGAVTINIINGGDTPTVRNGASASTTVNNTVTVKVTVVDESGTAIQSARVLLEADSGGDLPAEDSVTITRSGTTASVTHTAHGLANNDKVVIRGANEDEYNGIKTISNVTTNAYDYTVSGTPATPATGTITSTAVILDGLTDVSGIIQDTGFSYTSDQPVTGKSRKSSATPFFKTAGIIGTVTTGGFTTTIQMVSDE